MGNEQPTEPFASTYFLDSDSLPKIWQTDTFNPLVSKCFRDFWDDYFDRKLTNVYAVTLTISPRENHWIKKSPKINQVIYLNTKMKALGISGVWITEETKLKVKHLHGMLACSADAEFDTQKLYDKWKASVKVVRIRDADNFLTWRNYCTKMCLTPDIKQWLTLPC